MRKLVPLFMLFLSSCAASIPPVEVTRFHTEQPVGAGSITVVAASGVDVRSLEFHTYSAAVSRELSRLGYQPTDESSSPWIAEVEFSRGTRTDFARRSPITIGVGGGTYGGGVGIGVGTSFPVGTPRSTETVLSKMMVRIKSRATGHPVWEGRASTSAPAQDTSAQPTQSA